MNDGGATWSPATVTGRTEAITPARYMGSVTWDAVAALPSSAIAVLVRVSPRNDQGAGVPTASEPFTVLNTVIPEERIGTLTGHTNNVATVAFSPDGALLATGSGDATIRVWDVRTLAETRVLDEHQGIVRAVAFSPDGRRFVSAGADLDIRVWDRSTWTVIATLQGHVNVVTSLAFQTGGEVLASGSDDTTIRLWSMATYQELATLDGHADWVRSVQFSPDGSLLASSSQSEIRLWDMGSLSGVATLSGHTDWIPSIAFSPNGQLLASGSDDRTIMLWDVGARQSIATLPERDGKVWSVAFSPDGSVLATGDGGAKVTLWDATSGAEVASLGGHSGAVYALAYSPDGSVLAVAGAFDVSLWTSSAIATNMAPAISVDSPTLEAYEGSTTSLTVVATDPDGDVLRLSATGIPDNATLEPASGQFTFDPDYTQSGEYTVEFTVNDGRLGTDSVTVEITVANVDLFRVRNSPRRVSEGATLTLSLAANGALPDDVELAATGLPDNAAFDANTRTLTFSPDRTQAGKYDVVFRATQGGNWQRNIP